MKLIEHGLTQRRRHQTHRTEAFSSHPCGDVDVFPKCHPENVWEWMVSPFESKWWYPYYNIVAAISDFRWSNYPWNHLIWGLCLQETLQWNLANQATFRCGQCRWQGLLDWCRKGYHRLRRTKGSGVRRAWRDGFPIMVQKICQNNFWIYLTKGCTFIDDVNMQYIAVTAM